MRYARTCSSYVYNTSYNYLSKYILSSDISYYISYSNVLSNNYIRSF